MPYEKLCGTCGRPFVASDVRRIYCDHCRTLGAGRNRSRRESRQQHILSFVGVDGEGVDRPDGQHEYVMLSVGDATLHRDGSRLDLADDILPFLWEQYKTQPDVVFVGFFLGYDFAQWFRDLPEREARLLFTDIGAAERRSQRKTRENPLPDPVVWRGWEFDLMASRRFRLRPHHCQKSLFDDGCRNRTCRHRVAASSVVKRDGSGWFYLCDTGSFWQTSFINVIKPGNWAGTPVCTDAEFDLIEEGKAGRSRIVEYGDFSYASEMIRYNILENDLLGRVTSRLNQGFANEQIPIHLKKHEWFGPGRAAQTWMDLIHKRVADPAAVTFNRKKSLTEQRRNERGILSADINMSVPSWFREAAQASYYGGWFEIPMHGHIGHVWEYDINSAYPHIIASLPCLHTDLPHTGRYTRGTGDGYPRGEGTYTLLYGTFRGSDPYLGCLPFRTRVGSVLRPHVVKGWYWAHEIEANGRAGLLTSCEIEEWVSLQACQCLRPFNLPYVGIDRMYYLRLQMGKNTAAGKAFKLVYNSAYGKTAQSIGSPKYASAVYASLITAGTRANICDAISTHPQRSRAVAMVATDGVYFTSPHPALTLSKSDLGAWDPTYRENMTLLMPGVYWDDKSREMIGAGETPKLKSRGVAARDLAEQINILDHEWSIFHDSLSARDTRPEGWPGIDLRIRFAMTSPKLALHRGKWDTAGSVEHGTVRKLSADPGAKRVSAPYIGDGVVRTPVYEQWRTVETTPYARSFGWREEEDLISRDGSDPLDDFQQLLHG